MTAPINIDEAAFSAEVKESDKLVLVDFWAPWCGPCKMIAPVLEEIAEEHAATVKVVKVNVDENQGLAGKFGIMSIPTLLFFKGGNVVEQVVGAVAKDKLLDRISTLSA